MWNSMSKQKARGGVWMWGNRLLLVTVTEVHNKYFADKMHMNLFELQHYDKTNILLNTEIMLIISLCYFGEWFGKWIIQICDTFKRSECKLHVRTHTHTYSMYTHWHCNYIAIFFSFFFLSKLQYYITIWVLGFLFLSVIDIVNTDMLCGTVGGRGG